MTRRLRIEYVAYVLNKDGLPILYTSAGRYPDQGETEERVKRHFIAHFTSPAFPRLYKKMDYQVFRGEYDGDYLIRPREHPPWISTVTDHQYEISDEWVWGLESELFDDGKFAKWSYHRKEGTTDNHVSNFDRKPADWRGHMRQIITDTHSADARADVQINMLQRLLKETLGYFEDELIHTKGQLREDIPEDEAEMARLSKRISDIRDTKWMLDDYTDNHFQSAAKVILTQALIAGHGEGPVIVLPERYYRLGGALAERLVAGGGTLTDKHNRLNNMDANLSSDYNRTGFDRLVPKPDDGSLFDIDVDRLYSVLIKRPPQFGAAPLPAAATLPA